jgi:predicted nucleic acid-binding protein
MEDQLEKEGNPVGRFDTMIAAICINRGSQIATLNRKHFDRFKDFGLRVFDL